MTGIVPSTQPKENPGPAPSQARDSPVHGRAEANQPLKLVRTFRSPITARNAWSEAALLSIRQSASFRALNQMAPITAGWRRMAPEIEFLALQSSRLIVSGVTACLSARLRRDVDNA